MDKFIIDKMLTYKEFKEVPRDELIRLIAKGNEMHEADMKLMEEEKVIPSHYHLPEDDLNAIAAASQYRVMVEFKEKEGEAFFDEEE